LWLNKYLAVSNKIFARKIELISFIDYLKQTSLARGMGIVGGYAGIGFNLLADISEFGVGNSTKIAVRTQSVEHIVSVESDFKFWEESFHYFIRLIFQLLHLLFTFACVCLR